MVVILKSACIHNTMVVLSMSLYSHWITSMLGVLTLPLAVISAFWDILTSLLISSLEKNGLIVGYCTDLLWGG